jgi:hypothetical protein
LFFHQAKNGIRRRKATDAAKPYFVMPHNLFETLAYGLELSGKPKFSKFRNEISVLERIIIWDSQRMDLVWDSARPKTPNTSGCLTKP